ncbi:MAG: regulatory protein RecX [Mariprofundaceae bacterium]
MKSEVQVAYSIALRMLTRREHCEVEVRQKLEQRECDEIVIDSAIEQLKTYGYLSEERYAEAFLRSRIRKGETPWVAAYKARQKGADETILQVALEEAESEFDTLKACRELINKRDPQALRRKDERVWQRQARFLRNKGFDAATILRVMNSVDDRDEDL